MSNPTKHLKANALHHALFAAVLLLLLPPELALAAPAATVVGLSGASTVESGGARAVRLFQEDSRDLRRL